MAFRIATNVASINTQRWLGIAQVGMNKSLERLSSGYKINRAADDAAGIAIATRLNVKAVSVAKAIDNGNQAIAMLQTAESGIEQIANILTRLKELATQAASDNVSDDDRGALDQERAQLVDEIDKIAQNTMYGSVRLLSAEKSVTNVNASLTPAYGITNIEATGTAGTTATYTLSVTLGSGSATLTLTYDTKSQSVTITVPTDNFETKVVYFDQLGIKITVNKDLQNLSNKTFSVTSGGDPQFSFQLGSDNATRDQIDVTLTDFTASSLGLAQTNTIDTLAHARTYMGLVDSAISTLNEQRAVIGAAQNQISYHIANLEAMYENTKAAVSTIKDADFAKEMAEFTKYQIITQSGIAMLAQANQLPQLILSLMR